MVDENRFIDRGTGCIARMNERQFFGYELLEIDVPVDGAE